MTVLIDPPTWPGHGTKWSHVVSDSSLDELHDFAVRNEIPRRAFDLDHYDVPVSRYEELITGGAAPVSGKELIARLKDSGLRVRGRRRHKQLKESMFAQWIAAFPNAHDVGWELVGRWNEPHRHYHGLSHLKYSLDALGQIKEPDEPITLAVLALWFHDAIHDGRAGADENASALLVGELLGKYSSGGHGWISPEEINEVSRLVLVTAEHRPRSDDRLGHLVSDADLAILGAEPAIYLNYTEQIRLEYGHINDEDFRAGRAEILSALAKQSPLFRTDRGRELWQRAAERNVSDELEYLLTGP